jgi:uncharacterized protein YndB with AHSA1/START domain
MIPIQRLGTDTIRLERILDAPRDRVWRYLVEGELRRQWFAGGSDASPGEEVELVFDHDNLSADAVPYPEHYCRWKGAVARERVVEYDPPSIFAISWDEGREGIARFELSDAGEGRTRLVLTHSGITGPAPMANFGGGWHSHLAVLQGLFSGNRVRDFWALHAESEAVVAKAL